jgi:integral membrane sensor domain MASE1
MIPARASRRLCWQLGYTAGVLYGMGLRSWWAFVAGAIVGALLTL